MVTEMQNENKYDLDMKIYKLLQDEPFFAILSRQLNKVASNSVPTAGIRFNKEDASFEMIYNPNFMAGNIPHLPISWFYSRKMGTYARTLSRKLRALYRANFARL